ncbi:hypothetical protein DMH17_13780 [Raoultella planticola]|nr:hypothetical protein [Raoultella planticola]
MPLFKDEMILVASCKHPRISGPVTEADIYREEHAVVALIAMLRLACPGTALSISRRKLRIKGMRWSA